LKAKPMPMDHAGGEHAGHRMPDPGDLP
jgi:hypothetical protein